MWVSTQTFHLPKRGGSESEYEDASYPEESFQGELSAWRCAVADGATESAFSREWARLLVQSFGHHEFRIGEQQRRWADTVRQGPLPWYLESKISRGAHAAFVGLSLRDPRPDDTADAEPEDGEIHEGEGEGDAGPASGEAGPREEGELRKGTWRAVAVGDSCLFHVRENQLLTCGPLSSSDEFDNSPHLLSTASRSPISRSNPLVHLLSGTWEPEDAFYLATDAFAQCLLAEEEAGRPPWTFLQNLEPSGFADLVPVLRDKGRLHNDDTTLLRLEVT